MSVEVFPEQHEPRMLPLHLITERLSVRRLSASGLHRLTESLRHSGFLENFPLIVTPLPDGTFQLLDGNHRYEAALTLGLSAVPCVVKTTLSASERYRLAWQSNQAAETVVASTLVTYAEFIWARLAETDARGKLLYTQEDVARMLGWSHSTVSNYALLAKIDPQAWAVISTTFEPSAIEEQESVVEEISTTVEMPSTSPFTERVLRCILPLLPEQQLELVSKLAHSRDFSKGKFKVLAENYRARNEMEAFARVRLGDLGQEVYRVLSEEVSSGAYDADWRDPAHPKLEKLIVSLRDDWERAHRLHVIQGDFYYEVEKLGDGCIDLILTDPPYNLARANTFHLEGRSPISQDFGEWDKHEPDTFVALFEIWSRQWARLLRPGGSGYVFTSDRCLSYLRTALEEAGLHVKATIVWHKTNPGPQVVKTNFRSSVEYVLFFTKGQGGHTFNWQGEQEMHNHIETPICGGHERLVDGRGETLHPTQKPEQLLRHFMEISSHRGEVVFDGFAGVGTVGKVAKDLGRVFIGIEQDPRYVEAMQRRLAQ